MLVSAAICLILFCCGMIPVKIALMLRITRTVAFGSGLAPFRNAWALKRADKRIRSGKSRRSKSKKGRVPAALRAGHHLLRHGKLVEARAEGSISMGDAAHTALLCGAARAILGMLPRARLSLQPDFSAAGSNALLFCIFSVRLGHIILAVLIGARHDLTRRFAHGKASD